MARQALRANGPADSLADSGKHRTKNMVFDVAYLIWYLSQYMVLRPGDVINTGTPAGVALGLPGTPTSARATPSNCPSTASAPSARRSPTRERHPLARNHCPDHRPRHPVADDPDEQWHRVLDVNLMGVVRTTRAALPHLRRSAHASVVNLGSIVITTGLPQRG
ncbi:fumarylacetoacetate hydrolase family protein [Kitasatospora sp. Ki12]